MSKITYTTITIAIIFLPCWVITLGCLDHYNKLTILPWVDSIVSVVKIGSSTRQSLEANEPDGRFANKYDDVIKTNLMLNWVINCESSGNHLDVWGAEDEYGILQWKFETWEYLSEKYNFTGDWKNQDDQIELFLLTSEEDKIIHWSCYRKWLNK